MNGVPEFLAFFGFENDYKYFASASKNVHDSWGAAGCGHTYPHFRSSKFIIIPIDFLKNFQIPGFLAPAGDTYPHFEFCANHSSRELCH